MPRSSGPSRFVSRSFFFLLLYFVLDKMPVPVTGHRKYLLRGVYVLYFFFFASLVFATVLVLFTADIRFTTDIRLSHAIGEGNSACSYCSMLTQMWSIIYYTTYL